MTPDNDDRSLVRRTLEGDRAAFDALYEVHHPRVYAAVSRYASDVDVIQDLVQTTFVRAYDALSSFRGDSAFSTWLTQIALNASRSHLRSERARQTWVRATEDPEAAYDIDRHHFTNKSPEEAAQQTERREIVLDGIRSLPDRYRRAVWLRYVQDRSYEEIVQALQVPMGTVKTWLCRGRRQVRGRFIRAGLQAA